MALSTKRRFVAGPAATSSEKRAKKTEEGVTHPEEKGGSHEDQDQERKDKVRRDFRSLELALNAYRAGGKVAVWDRVRDSVQHMSTQSFGLEDLSLVMQVWPEGYVCNWSKVAPDSLSAKEWHLCIAVNASAATCATGRTRVQNRLDHFEHLLLATELTSLQPRSLLPVKPSHSSRETTAGKNGGAGKSLAALNPNELKELKERNRAGAIERSTSASTAIVAGGLEHLRKMAVERENSTKIRAAELKEESKKAAMVTLLSSLTSLCDTLRSLALSKNKRSVFVTSELVKELAPSLRISEHDLRSRLCKVSEELPEFLTMLPFDDRVAVETLRLNLHCDYALVRKKCSTFVASQLAALDIAVGRV